MRRFPLVFALLGTALVAAVPLLAEVVKGMARFSRLGPDVDRVANALQAALCWPWGIWLVHPVYRIALALPWFLVLGYGLRLLHLRFLKGRYRYMWVSLIAIWLVLRLFPNILLWGESNAPSQSHGTVARGHLENGKRIPYAGNNYRSYSFAGYLAGRTFAHEKVRAAVLDAYRGLEETLPGQEFVLMETGLRFGGRFLPHRTHRNGLSVDFMTPLLKANEPYVASGLFNGYGYGRNFDNRGQKGSLAIDYETMALHLIALEKAANQHGLRIQKVIFDPVLRPYLFDTPSGRKIRHLPFTRNRVAVRHDDHYHVDFGLD